MKSQPVPLIAVSNHGDVVGGGELSLLDLLKSLDRSRWAPTLVVPGEGAMAEGGRLLGLPVQVVSLPSLRRPGPAAVQALSRLLTLCRTTGARLIHANGSRAMFYAGLAGWLLRRPVMWHVRVADREALLDRFLARLAGIVVVNSRAVEARFTWLSKPKVHCVYNGVDLQRFSPRSPSAHIRHALGLPQKGAIVLTVGRFVPYKGYQDLLDAAELVNRELQDIHWLLVGDGELQETLQQYSTRPGLNGSVHFPGWRDDIPDLLALCDLFVLSSRGEHFGRVLIEAMAMGKAVVATSSGGVPEVVADGETGLLVPPQTPAELARAITFLLRDPSYKQRLGRCGRTRVEKLFSLESHAGAIEALYVKMLGGPDARV